MLPKDDVMLLSLVNTALRDNCGTADDFAAACGVSREYIDKRLAGINYFYDDKTNQYR